MSHASVDEWGEALRLAARLGSLPPEAIDGALAALRERRGALSVALVAYTVDLPEPVLVELLAQVRALAGAAQQADPTERRAIGLPRLPGFDVLEKLGAGGMGTAYRARDLGLDREVALKLLSPQIADDPEALLRFQREGRALAKVNDPHVVSCYRVGAADGLPFLVLELLEGGDAGQLARREGGRLDERRALEIARDSAAGLVALEQVGLIHRDVKPNNIFLTAEGRAKLGDLGLARTANDLITLSGFAVGTPAFMSPEQLNAEADLDARADVYALGASLYFLLTGAVPPKTGATPPDPREHAPELSPGTAALVQRALEPQRDARHESARALHTHLSEALRALDAPPVARPWTPSERPQLFAAVAGGAAVLGIALALLTAQRSPPRELPVATAASATPSPSPPPPSLATPAPTPAPTSTAPTPASSSAATKPAPTPAPAPSTPPPTPTPTPAPPTPTPTPTRLPLAFDVGGSAETLTRRADGAYVSRPGASPWSRAGLFDRTARRLPLSVTWTCVARATRDSTTQNLGHQGFQGSAGFFYELGLRAQDHRITAGNELQGGAWWLSLQVLTSGQVVGLIRVVNRDKPPAQDLTVVGNRTPGVAVVGRIAFRADGAPFTVDADLTQTGWSLTVRRGTEQLAAAKRPWSHGRAPITTELARDVYLWGHLGNWSNGRGTGTLSTILTQR